MIDPGHNGLNYTDPSFINRLVFIGTGYKACDTTGTQTNAGYPESAFAFDLAVRLADKLRALGATVIFTRTDNSGVGPCITTRAQVGNNAHAAAVISLHADGGPASGLGFHVIEPAAVGINNSIISASARLGSAVVGAFSAVKQRSTYIGGGTGVSVRNDLGGLNLSTVPKVFIECGNMRNTADAARLSSPSWRDSAATALSRAFLAYLG